MKLKFRAWGWLAVTLVLLALFAGIFYRYTQPMQNEYYDISITKEIDEVTTIDRCSELGWSVYLQEGETVTPLTYDGYGCYEGLEHLGQTFYFSRVMTEELLSPSLSLLAINRNYSVFLDGVLIYTDCPEEDNRIGYLTLPTRDEQRSEDLVISLPEDYVGKTLTIAQSTPNYAETPRMATRVIPSTVTLYCSYAYESALIAESFRTACLGILAYMVGAVLLLFFLTHLMQGHTDVSLLLLALTLFANMAAYLYSTTYRMKYFGIPVGVDPTLACQYLTQGMLLLFLAVKARHTRIAAWFVALLSLSVDLFQIVLMLFDQPGQGPFRTIAAHLEQVCSLLVLTMPLVLSWIERRRGHGFHRWFAPLVSLGLPLLLAVRLLQPDRSVYLHSLLTALSHLSVRQLLWPIANMMTVVALLITLVQIIHGELVAHTERHLMKEMVAMSQQRYENLRRHNEEVMMLRHDMKRHFRLLRQTTTDEKTAAYLDELIGQNEKIQPVIQSGNDILDIILCSRLSAALEAGVQVDITRADAPVTLPITDADLCSLVMNLMDNAISAAGSAPTPFIKLDLHQKSGFFVFVCENAMNPEGAETKKEKTVPEHGLGLKIVHQIVERYGHLLTTEATGGTYKVSLAIPLPQPAK